MKYVLVIDADEKEIDDGSVIIIGSFGIITDRIRPLPQRKETDGTEPFEIFMHREGWNQCLDEILGETE